MSTVTVNVEEKLFQNRYRVDRAGRTSASRARTSA
jgi:ferredoxin-like protein FixX